MKKPHCEGTNLKARPKVSHALPERASLAAKLAVAYSEEFLQYDLGRSHPLKPIRLKLTIDLMRAMGIVGSGNVTIVEPRVATDEELTLFHEREYLDLVRMMSKRGQGMLDMGDTPAFKGCYEASARAVGASLDMVDAVMNGKADHGFNIAGGLHHAHADRASGFCIFNDPAITVAYLKRKYGFKRLMCLDIDAHHGDGVMYGFYSDPALLDVDFHEDGRHLFPGTGFTEEAGEGEAFGLKVNVPVPPFTTDTPYLAAFDEVVPKLVRAYRPEFILVQCGADSHFEDYLAHLSLTTRTYEHVLTKMHDLAHEVANGRIVAFGGGGYKMGNVARCWTSVAAMLSENAVQEEIPLEWRKEYENLVNELPPVFMRDQVEKQPKETGKKIEQRIDEVITDLKRRIPLLSR